MVQLKSFEAAAMDAKVPSASGGKPKKLPLHIKLVVGAAAGVFGTSCIFPIDMVKTRLQANPQNYAGPIDCLTKIIRIEGGFPALYRGLAPNLIGVTPEKAIKLAVNEFIRDKLEKEDGSISLFHEILAGGGAGFCQIIATNPMEIVKIRMQLQSTLPEVERQSVFEVVQHLGIRGMYRGSIATLARDVPFSVLFFPGYSNLKNLTSDEKGKNSIGSLLISGTAAGALASSAVTPMDVVKTRLQVSGGLQKYVNLPNCFKVILNEEGVGALFKGAIARCAVVGPLFGITLLAFEQQKKYMVAKGLL